MIDLRRSKAACMLLGGSTCVLLAALLLAHWPPVSAEAASRHRHYAANTRGDHDGAAAVGFNLVDIGTLSALRALQPSVKVLYWLGNGYNLTCSWRLSDQQVRATVSQVKDNPKFSGIYFISDEPHPAICPDAPHKVAERSALIHALDPRGKTFIIVQNAFSDPTEFEKMKDSADYIGVNPYPCNVKNAATGCNYPALRQRIDQALAVDIAVNRIVPVFQTFGQACTVGGQSYYRLPTVAETEAMLAIWDEKLPMASRPFDMAYSWKEQTTRACPTLETADGTRNPDLRTVYKRYFARNEGVPASRTPF